MLRANTPSCRIGALDPNVVSPQLAKKTPAATLVMLFGLTITSVFLPSDQASDIFSFAAVGAILSLGLATAIEATAGIRTLVRADILMLWVLFGLTFLEFLFPQSNVNALV